MQKRDIKGIKVVESVCKLKGEGERGEKECGKQSERRKEEEQRK